MDLDIMLSEISQQEKDQCHRIYSYVESNEQTELTRKMGTDSDGEQNDSWLWGEVRGWRG